LPLAAIHMQAFDVDHDDLFAFDEKVSDLGILLEVKR